MVFVSYLVALVCLIFTISCVESTLDDDCNSQQADDGITCDDSQETLYALVSNGCNSFCQCTPQTSTSYTWRNMNCPAGLLFNDYAQYCDWSYNVSCQ